MRRFLMLACLTIAGRSRTVARQSGMAASPDLVSHADASAEADGFAISLPSAQLADLIQINCVNRVRGAFRVSSKGREGLLFFDAGQLVHAEVGAVLGLDAVVQMLDWRGGCIEPCGADWPRVSTIDMGADALLLCAAQRLDEMPLRPSEAPAELTTKVVRRVDLPGAPEAAARAEKPISPAATTTARPPSAPLATARPPRSHASEQLGRLQVAQLRFDGTIQTLKSGATTDLADTAFFSQRMATQLGEALALGACHAIYVEGEREGVIVIQGRSIVATRGEKSALGFVLARLGLT